MLPKTAKTPKNFVKNAKFGLTCTSKYKYYHNGNVKWEQKSVDKSQVSTNLWVASTPAYILKG